MLEVLDKFESGSLTSTQVEESMDFHAEALERIGMKEITAIRELSYQLVVSDLDAGDEDDIDAPDVKDILKRYREFLKKLPIG